MTRIGFLGAFSIENAGDQLLGYAVRQVFEKRLPKAEQRLFAPELRGAFWRHAWDDARGLGAPITRVPIDGTSWTKGLDAVVIGGGAILRLEPEFRPFVLGDPRRWSRDVPAAWNALGAEATPAYLAAHRADYDRVAQCCEKLAYASVRNELTARFVRRCGYRGDLHVVPDPTLLLETPDDDFAERTLRASGVDTSAYVLGLSVGTSLRDARAQHFHQELFSTLAKLVAKGTLEVVLFPFGEVYGDSELARMAHSAIPGSKLLDANLSALERWRLVGGLDFYLCARWHAMLAAFAQDVPFLVMDEYLSDATASSKIREFVADTDLEELYLAPLVSMRPALKLDNAFSIVGAEDYSFAPRLSAMRERLRRHYDALIAALHL